MAQSKNIYSKFGNQMTTRAEQCLIDTIPHITALSCSAIEERDARTTLKILVIEDHPFSRKLLILGLGAGIDVIAASNGREGVALYSLYAPDIVFLDIGLPGINGHNTLKKIMQIDPDAYIIMLSISTSQIDIEEALTNGAKGYIIKPINKKLLSDTVHQYTLQRKTNNNHSKQLYLRNTHILLVEDNKINQEVATQILAQYGCHITKAENGIKAVEEFEQKVFDLILMDCLMPEMDGFEATQTIRKMEKKRKIPFTPIIAFTANTMRGDREKCLQIGMDDYISKPVKQQDIEQILCKWIPDNKQSEITNSKETNDSYIEINNMNNVIINTQTLQELKSIMGDKFSYIIEEYLQVASEMLYEIGQAINNEDYKRTKEAAHALKSPSAQIGVIALEKVLKEIEMLDYNKSSKDALSLHKKAITLFPQAENILRKAAHLKST